MAVSIENKIELFRKIIFSDIENNSSNKKQKLLECFEAEKVRLRKDTEQKKQKIINEEVSKAEKDKKQILAKANAEQYHIVLLKNQEFTEEMIRLVKKEASKYIRSEEYKDYIRDNLIKAEKLMEQSKFAYYYFTKTDMETLGSFINSSIASIRGEGTYTVKEAEPGIIGGFLMEDEDKLIQVNYTLQSLIEENRELIGSNISRRLHMS
jgi:vacuolar-type H+-ATPase subunit E/Vma4